MRRWPRSHPGQAVDEAEPPRWKESRSTGTANGAASNLCASAVALGLGVVDVAAVRGATGETHGALLVVRRIVTTAQTARPQPPKRNSRPRSCPSVLGMSSVDLRGRHCSTGRPVRPGPAPHSPYRSIDSARPTRCWATGPATQCCAACRPHRVLGRAQRTRRPCRWRPLPGHSHRHHRRGRRAARGRSAARVGCRTGHGRRHRDQPVGERRRVLRLRADAVTRMPCCGAPPGPARQRARSRRRHACSVYTEQTTAGRLSRLQLDLELAGAVSSGQPAHALPARVRPRARARSWAVEALLRWQHPQRGLLSADVFVPESEQTRTFVAVQHWVIETTCRQLAQWRDAGLADNLVLRLNVPAPQVLHGGRDRSALRSADQVRAARVAGLHRADRTSHAGRTRPARRRTRRPGARAASRSRSTTSAPAKAPCRTCSCCRSTS